MIVPDINLLLYAYDASSPFHAKAAAWWEACLSGVEPVGLAEVVIFGFLRLSTNPRVFERSLAPAEAAGHVRAWLAQPVVRRLDSSFDNTRRVLDLLETLGTAGNLVTDAQIASLALENDAVVYTNDAHFVRFEGLRWLNPITGVGSKSLGRGQR